MLPFKGLRNSLGKNTLIDVRQRLRMLKIFDPILEAWRKEAIREIKAKRRKKVKIVAFRKQIQKRKN